jgi:hypothetical protein
MHLYPDIEYIDNTPQRPTSVAKGTKQNHIIIPTNNVYYVFEKHLGWCLRIDPLFGDTEIITEKDFENYKQKYLGMTLKVLLPLQIEGITNKYVFSFKVIGFVESEK